MANSSGKITADSEEPHPLFGQMNGSNYYGDESHCYWTERRDGSWDWYAARYHGHGPRESGTADDLGAAMDAALAARARLIEEAAP